MESSKSAGLWRFGPTVTGSILAGDKSADGLRCLVDTGASRSIVAYELADKLGIVQQTKTVKGRGHGFGEADFHTLDGFELKLESTTLNFPAGSTVSADNLVFSTAHVILGRDVLRFCRMSYDGPTGAVDLDFHMPTLERSTTVERDEQGRIVNLRC